ncbi:DNA metabolism protein [Lithospermum erythrorhizon]|uniref:DNA metabolism protein n=1 Tax=Lithospermum erythrorhizon TaxID=34254 RepID=A0AAV3Q980_LITER
MGKKKKRASAKMWCYYCDREFEDEKILIQHQKAKHFKCHVCHKKLSTAGGMTIHVLQVHKENITKVPNAKPGRESTDIEIYGMQGIPADILASHYGDEEEEAPAKSTKIETPASHAVGMGYPPTLGARPQLFRHPVPMPHAGWPVPPRPQPWYPQYPAGSIPPPPMGLPSQPLFPLQNMRPGMVSMAPSVPPALPITPPGLTSVPNVSVSQPLFPVVSNSNMSSQSAPRSAPMVSSTQFSSMLDPNSSVNPHLGTTAFITSNYQTTGIQAPIPGSSHSYASGPNTGGPSIGPPPVIANKAPANLSATNEVYLVWDDEAMSMEERRMSLLKYQVHDETSQVSHNYLKPTLLRMITELSCHIYLGRLALFVLFGPSLLIRSIHRRYRCIPFYITLSHSPY